MRSRRAPPGPPAEPEEQEPVSRRHIYSRAQLVWLMDHIEPFVHAPKESGNRKKNAEKKEKSAKEQALDDLFESWVSEFPAASVDRDQLARKVRSLVLAGEKGMVPRAIRAEAKAGAEYAAPGASSSSSSSSSSSASSSSKQDGRDAAGKGSGEKDREEEEEVEGEDAEDPKALWDKFRSYTSLVRSGPRAADAAREAREAEEAWKAARSAFATELLSLSGPNRTHIIAQREAQLVKEKQEVDRKWAIAADVAAQERNSKKRASSSSSTPGSLALEDARRAAKKRAVAADSSSSSSSSSADSRRATRKQTNAARAVPPPSASSASSSVSSSSASAATASSAAPRRTGHPSHAAAGSSSAVTKISPPRALVYELVHDMENLQKQVADMSGRLRDFFEAYERGAGNSI